MISNILFLLPLIASCNGLSRSIACNIDGKGSSHEFVFKEDEYKDEEVFNEKALQKFESWYTSFILSPEPLDNPDKVILDLYNCIDQYNKLPLVGPMAQLAADKAWKVWKQGKQILGKEKEIFGNDPYGLTLIRASLRKIPETYKQPCLDMVLRLVDKLFEKNPKYKALFNKLTNFEQFLSEKVKQSDPHYSDDMAYVKKLFMEHFNTINEDRFYSDSYADSILYRQDGPVLFPLVVYSGSDAIVNDFLDFLKKQDREIDLNNHMLL